MWNCYEERIMKRYEAFWNCDNDTPLLHVMAPRDNADWSNAPVAPERVEQRWLDTDYVIRQNRFIMKNTAYIGEAFPMFFANFGPDILGAMLGGDIAFGQDTSWALHIAEDSAGLPELRFDENNVWVRRVAERTRALLEDSRGDYAVGNNDYHTGLDALASLIGPEQLCVDLLTQPETVKARIADCTEAFLKIFAWENALIRGQQDFSTNWMGHFGRRKWYVTSCDFSALISPVLFDEFAVPYLNSELESHEGSIYHLDGKDALRHEDRLLSMKVDGIQWVYGAGAPSARHWIPFLQKIQAAGKRIEVAVNADDVKPLMDALKPQGLLMKAYASTQGEAEDMYRFVTSPRGRE